MLAIDLVPLTNVEKTKSRFYMEDDKGKMAAEKFLENCYPGIKAWLSSPIILLSERVVLIKTLFLFLKIDFYLKPIFGFSINNTALKET